MDLLYLVACAPSGGGGGIYSYLLSTDGRLNRRAYFSCEKPMYTVRGATALHTVVRYEDEAGGKMSGAYFSLPLDENGNFGVASPLVPSLGDVPCHLAVLQGDTYVVNYISGNVVKNGKSVVQHIGKGVHATRQNSPHTHFVGVLPDGNLGVCDLGIDTLKIYDRELMAVSEARVPSGYGIRHFVTKSTANGCIIYAVNELVPSISRFHYANGVATYLDSVMIPCGCKDATAAAIRLSQDGNFLYASVRGENVLCVFALNADGALSLVQTVPCGGDGPRDLAICGTHLVCANQISGTVTVFALHGGRIGALADKISLPDPLCVVI